MTGSDPSPDAARLPRLMLVLGRARAGKSADAERVIAQARALASRSASSDHGSMTLPGHS